MVSLKEIPRWVFRFLLIGVIFVYFAGIIHWKVNYEVDTSDLLMQSFKDRVKDCLEAEKELIKCAKNERFVAEVVVDGKKEILKSTKFEFSEGLRDLGYVIYDEDSFNVLVDGKLKEIEFKGAIINVEKIK